MPLTVCTPPPSAPSHMPRSPCTVRYTCSRSCPCRAIVPSSSAPCSHQVTKLPLPPANVVFLGAGAPMGPHQKMGTTLSQITKEMLESHPRLHLMHSMPAGDEVDPRALYHGRSLVFDQVRCKIPVIGALLVQALGEHPTGPGKTFRDSHD